MSTLWKIINYFSPQHIALCLTDVTIRVVTDFIHSHNCCFIRLSHKWPEPLLFAYMKYWSRRRADQNSDTYSTGWPRMLVWRMSLRRTKSAITSWVGSIAILYQPVNRNSQTWVWNIPGYLSLVTRKPVFGVSDQVRLKPACSASGTR